MTKEERHQKFLKEHPNWQLWQESGSYKKLKVLEKEIEVYVYDNYFKNVPPEKKQQARQILYVARRAGRVKRLPCEKCGKQKVQAHHEDYSKPLKIRWLCTKHHAERHLELNRKLVRVIKRVKIGKYKKIKNMSRQEGLSTI